MLRLFFIIECGIMHFLCGMRVFKIWAYLHTLGYLCAKYRFCHGLHCWASPRRKIAYIVSHLITQPAYLMPREPSNCASEYIFFKFSPLVATHKTAGNIFSH